MNILLPIGKASNRIKSSPHQSLIKINKTVNLLQFQLDILGSLLNHLKIYIFVDEYKDQIIPIINSFKELGNINSEINIVEDKFSSLSSCLVGGFELIKQEECIVVMGDTIFNKSAIRCLMNRTSSSFLVDNKNLFSRGEIGLWHDKGTIKHFSYSLPLKWSHICYLNKDFISKYSMIHDEHFLPYEIFNKMVDITHMNIVQSKHAKVIEIDKPKDARLARQIFG